MTGAGEGNRTLVCSLGSCRSTIELHPHWTPPLLIGSCRRRNSIARRLAIPFAARQVSFLRSAPSQTGKSGNAAVTVTARIDKRIAASPRSVPRKRPVGNGNPAGARQHLERRSAPRR